MPLPLELAAAPAAAGCRAASPSCAGTWRHLTPSTARRWPSRWGPAAAAGPPPAPPTPAGGRRPPAAVRPACTHTGISIYNTCPTQPGGRSSTAALESSSSCTIDGRAAAPRMWAAHASSGQAAAAMNFTGLLLHLVQRCIWGLAAAGKWTHVPPTPRGLSKHAGC